MLGLPAPYRTPSNTASHFSRIKNPYFAMSVYSGGPIGLRLRLVLFRYLNSLGITASFTRTCSPCLINRCTIVFYILAIPYMLSLSYLTIAIYAMPPPPKAY
jgi:hypothetical protein